MGEIWYSFIKDRNEDSHIDDVWTEIETYAVTVGTQFQAHFPDDDSILAEGKNGFLQLPKTTVAPWPGM